jgi:GNAT superfamily N-acetyltransferase
MLTLRPATPADNLLLAEFGAQTFAAAFAADNTPEDMAAYLAASFSPEKQAAELAEPGALFIIAEDDGAPAGYARLRAAPPPAGIPGWRPLEIVRFYAHPARIGQGIGAALMQACLEEAARRGCDTLWLDVWEKNPRAIAFYQNWGFTQVGEQNFQLGADLQHDLLMARPVEAK